MEPPKSNLQHKTVNGISGSVRTTERAVNEKPVAAHEKIHMSPIRKVAALLDEARERGDIISFGGGAPSVPPPQGFLEEFSRLLTSDPLKSCGYTGTRGIPELRTAVAEDVRKGNVKSSVAGQV